MKKINLLLFFLLLACALPAQDGISVFIGRANRYASVELSDYRKRLCLEYNISNHSLDDYYRRCGNDWGNVGIALEIARTSGKKMRDVCDYYKRYHRYGWNRILVEIGIKPGRRRCCVPMWSCGDYSPVFGVINARSGKNVLPSARICYKIII